MPTLNDSRLHLRAVSAVAGLALGMILTALAMQIWGGEPAGTMLRLMLAGAVIQALGSVVAAVVARRSDARLRNAIERAVRALPDRADPLGSPVPARVVRTRPERKRTAGVVDLAAHPPARLDKAARIVVLTALVPSGPPRRVGVLVPSAVAGALNGGSIHLVHPSPAHDEVAVLNVRARSGELEAARNDPRWSTEELPTDGSVAGGWGAAAGFGVLGLAVGAGFVALAVAVL